MLVKLVINTRPDLITFYLIVDTINQADVHARMIIGEHDIDYHVEVLNNMYSLDKLCYIKDLTQVNCEKSKQIIKELIG